MENFGGSQKSFITSLEPNPAWGGPYFLVAAFILALPGAGSYLQLSSWPCLGQGPTCSFHLGPAWGRALLAAYDKSVHPKTTLCDTVNICNVSLFHKYIKMTIHLKFYTL
jgi:hypothetical protein